MDNNSQTVDFKSLKNIANNDENFMKELIGIFLEQVPEFVTNLTQLYTENNWEKLAREAHTAKSSVMIFGMTETGKLLNKIEIWAENKDIAEIGPALKLVETDLNNAKIHLMKVMDTGKFA
jgi:HPt (histidine-containing phosphotransfer) domain-containing protein